MNEYDDIFLKRFWSKVDKNGKISREGMSNCWEWTASKSRDGYGSIGYKNKHLKAHRVSFEIFNQKIPEGMQVLHVCDNPSCVNPDHLFLGTQQDNIKDMYNKNREARLKGSKNGRSVLTESQVLEIRYEYNKNKSFVEGLQYQLAEKYGVTKSVILKVISGKSWKHVGGIIKKFNHKLNKEQVEKIIELLEQKELNYTNIAKMFGVERRLIVSVKNGTYWKEKYD